MKIRISPKLKVSKGSNLRRVPIGRLPDLMREPDADRMIYRNSGRGMDFDVEVKTLASREALRAFLKKEAQRSDYRSLGGNEWMAVVRDVVSRNMLTYPFLEREER